MIPWDTRSLVLHKSAKENTRYAISCITVVRSSVLRYTKCCCRIKGCHRQHVNIAACARTLCQMSYLHEIFAEVLKFRNRSGGVGSVRVVAADTRSRFHMTRPESQNAGQGAVPLNKCNKHLTAVRYTRLSMCRLPPSQRIHEQNTSDGANMSFIFPHKPLFFTPVG